MHGLSSRLERNAGGSIPDFCQTMSSLELILKAYEQAGSILPSQYQCRQRSVQIKQREVAILDAIYRYLVEPDGFEPTTSCLQSRRSTN